MFSNHDNSDDSDASEMVDAAPIPAHVQAKMKKQLHDFRAHWENDRPMISRRRRWWPAVSIPLAAAAAIVVLVLLWTGRGGGPLPDSNVAWAQVAQQLQKIKTASGMMRSTTLMTEGRISIQPPDLDRWYFRAPDQKRSEKIDPAVTSAPATTEPAQQWGMVNPTGFPNTSVAQIGGRRYVLQRVLLAPEAVKEPEGPAKFLAQIRNLDPSKVTRREEEKQADGRTLLRFETVDIEPGQPMTIWVDPATSLPVRCIINGSKVVGGIVTDKFTVEFSDLRFDPPLDENLFAWPDLGSTPLEWAVTIYAPPGAIWGQLKVAITGPDGRQLIDTGDFAVPGNARGTTDRPRTVFDLKPEAIKQLKEFCTAHVGKELTIQVEGAPAQKVKVIGPLSHLGVAMPEVDAKPTMQGDSGPTTQKPSKPEGKAGASTANVSPRVP